ncbi:phosphatase PAP2 family protein [Streptantibioticus ferralitis]|uniref:Phosphatase PAP2 family protein n=1 Tax=Streptantibioticus ferralitis TaxID=236510 RepID=A0ABT5YY69_9ACTN|nr:phosphatase PAP2 family protein [Streptantibioticus ferralitis]MDF2256490.1 phosphatase PAP2 family protein [Streptantibioticus ferralitis]
MRTDRIVAHSAQQLEQERPSDREVPGMSRTRRVLFGTTTVAYAAIVAAVLGSSWLVRLDWQVMLFRPYKQWPQFHAFLDYFVVLGQRGPTAVMVAAWLAWRTWKHRTLRPLLVLGTALLLLNITVGAVKYGLGRLGPHYATTIGSAELFQGGDIFPSGHTANAVVTWGILAYLATTPRARRVLSVVSAVLSLAVGMTTIYLGTHWVTDVLSGWCAGLLVLFALPWCEPMISRAEEWLLVKWAQLRSRWALTPVTVSPIAAGSGLIPPRGAADDAPVLQPVGAGAPARPASAAVASRGAHHGLRGHTARHERPTVPPPGNRRLPHGERSTRPVPPVQTAHRGRGAQG